MCAVPPTADLFIHQKARRGRHDPAAGPLAPGGPTRQPSPLSPLRSVVDTGTEDVEQRIRALVADRSLDIHFQPIVDLETGRNLGVEALARFPGDPDRTPARWFADASSVGLRTALERAALELALEQIPRLPEGMYLSINLSAESLLSRRVREALAGLG